jgi:hypothetical protein
MGDEDRCCVNVRHVFNPFQINYFNFDNQIIFTLLVLSTKLWSSLRYNNRQTPLSRKETSVWGKRNNVVYQHSSREIETYMKCKLAEATRLDKIEDKVLSKKLNIYTKKCRTGQWRKKFRLRFNQKDINRDVEEKQKYTNIKRRLRSGLTSTQKYYYRLSLH